MREETHTSANRKQCAIQHTRKLEEAARLRLEILKSEQASAMCMMRVILFLMISAALIASWIYLIPKG